MKCRTETTQYLAIIAVILGIGLTCFANGAESIAVNQKVFRPTRYVPYSEGAQEGVQIISKNTWREMGMKPVPSAYYRRKASKKVDAQKFRTCIFFQLCSLKSECFHYGRYGKCSW